MQQVCYPPDRFIKVKRHAPSECSSAKLFAQNVAWPCLYLEHAKGGGTEAHTAARQFAQGGAKAPARTEGAAVVATSVHTGKAVQQVVTWHAQASKPDGTVVHPLQSNLCISMAVS